MLTHLVKVPLMLRPAAMEDIPALMLLQGNSGAVPQVCALPSPVQAGIPQITLMPFITCNVGARLCHKPCGRCWTGVHNKAPHLVQALMPQGELQELVQSYPAYSYVVDFSGDVVAALVSRPLEVMPCMLLKVLLSMLLQAEGPRLGWPCQVTQ